MQEMILNSLENPWILNICRVALCLIIAGIYFIPYIIARSRKMNQIGGVFFLNFFLGWTFLGWIVSFVWACVGSKEE